MRRFSKKEKRTMRRFSKKRKITMMRLSREKGNAPVVEQILWLEVSVNDSLLVHISHCWQHLWNRQGHFHSTFYDLEKESNDRNWGNKKLTRSPNAFDIWHFYLFDEVGGVLFWIGTLLHDSIKELAPRHSEPGGKNRSVFCSKIYCYSLLESCCCYISFFLGHCWCIFLLFSLACELIQFLHRNWITISLRWKKIT